MILVCVTDQQSCDRLIYAGYRLAQNRSEPLEVITVRPRVMGKCTDSNDCWLASPEIQYLTEITISLDAELHFIFNDQPAEAIAQYIKNHKIKRLVTGVPPDGEISPFNQTIAERVPELLIYQVAESGTVIKPGQSPDKSKVSRGRSVFD